MQTTVISSDITRFGDTALVTIRSHVETAPGIWRHQQLEQYETLSRGAAASARRSVAQVKKRLAAGGAA